MGKRFNQLRYKISNSIKNSPTGLKRGNTMKKLIERIINFIKGLFTKKTKTAELHPETKVVKATEKKNVYVSKCGAGYNKECTHRRHKKYLYRAVKRQTV